MKLTYNNHHNIFLIKNKYLNKNVFSILPTKHGVVVLLLSFSSLHCLRNIERSYILNHMRPEGRQGNTLG